MTHLREQFWAVEVPKDAKDFALHHLGDIQKLVFTSATQDPLGCGGDMIILGPGTWEIVCTSKEATEDDCAIIVGLSFQDVVHGYGRTFFHDLLTSKGCDLNNNWLILKNTL